MISIIITSINLDLRAQLSENIKRTIGTEHEIIAIDNTGNKYSISQAYNLGANQAQYPYLCFVHEDILFHTKNWGELIVKHLSTGNNSLVGVLGCLIKTLMPSGVYTPIKYLNRINQLQRKRDGGIDHYYENPLNELYSQVATLDGMFLATTKSNHNKYSFDEKMLKGFHGYDIDYSLGQATNGKVIVVYDILIEHLSHGGNTKGWIDAQLQITEKWQQHLPAHVNLRKTEIIEAETVNAEILLTSLYNNSYKKNAQVKYLARLLYLRPFSRKNFYFLRKFFFFGLLESRLKKIYTRLNGKSNLFII